MKLIKGFSKVTSMLLLSIFVSTTNLFAQNVFTIMQNDEPGNALTEFFRDIPLAAKYFTEERNPDKGSILVKELLTEKMDSIVAFALDPEKEKLKKTFEYDENGFYTKITEVYYKNGVENSGISLICDFRDDGRFNYYMEMEFVNGMWRRKSRRTYTYDASGNLISYTGEDWDTTANEWVNDFKYDLVYDGNNNLITKTFYTWNSSAWEEYSKYEYTYDSNNNMISYIKMKWNNGSWENSYKYEYTYDANNNMIESVYIRWTNGAWVNYYRHTYSYDANNNKISSNSYKWDEVNNVWENRYWSLFTYNENNQLTFEINKEWDSANSTWEDRNRSTYEYNSNYQILRKLFETYSSGSWDKNYEELFSYKDNGSLENYIFDDGSSKERTSFRYNSMGMCNGGKNEKWVTDHWEISDNAMFLSWVYTFDPNSYYSDLLNVDYFAVRSYGYEYSVYYQGITSVDENKPAPTEFSLQQNYPNPFNPTTVISYSVPEAGFVSLKVYDVLGNEVATLVNGNVTPGNYKVEFNASKLSSGMYIYKLTSREYSLTRKMLLLK